MAPKMMIEHKGSLTQCKRLCKYTLKGKILEDEDGLQCRRLIVATEVCGLALPGNTDTAYLGGCFNNHEAVKYKPLAPGESFDLTQIKVSVRHPTDPYVTAVRLTNDNTVYTPEEPGKLLDTLKSIGFLAVTAIIFGVAAFVVFLEVRRRKDVERKELTAKDFDTEMVVEFEVPQSTRTTMSSFEIERKVVN
eukprot:TRINITY_DN1024_c0_g1_i5.p1 TRINITY_DN1024_c0_g1~~TRINITY_DN1024_c0_g1_i5.p1  ORF type:complete len:192 (+),score=38.14 TRINITY_DN1024_c0_g1_i5:198-773(+)